MVTPTDYTVLVQLTRAIVANSTSPDAEGFDCRRWLDRWLTLRQPALGGRTPADQLRQPGGLETVKRVLGAIESGAYQ